MMRWACLLCFGAAALSGCATFDDYHYCLVNHHRSDSAWKKCHAAQELRGLSAHYASGWKQGYFDVSTGGSGEPPAVPPSKYWSPWFQGQKGQAAVEDWFVGYQDGATAAESSGTGAWHPVYTGPTVPTAPVGWPTTEMFPAELPAATFSEPLPTEGPLTIEPNQQIFRWPAHSVIAQEPSTNSLEAVPPLEASGKVLPPVEDPHAVAPVFTDE